MKRSHKIINCKEHFSNTCRTTPFIVVEYDFDYANCDDKAILDDLIVAAETLASQVNPGAANDSTVARSNNRILANCIAGVVSEFCWKDFLNAKPDSKDAKRVDSTPFTEAKNQIDLEVIANHKKIEVRSSFPRNGIEFAICNNPYEFDILGPYSNSYKPGEIQKDYYVRTLYHLERPTDIINVIRSNSFSVILAGGATWSMMLDDSISKDKSLVPDDEMVESETLYRVVPYHNALDCRDIYLLISQEK